MLHIMGYCLFLRVHLWGLFPMLAPGAENTRAGLIAFAASRSLESSALSGGFLNIQEAFQRAKRTISNVVNVVCSKTELMGHFIGARECFTDLLLSEASQIIS